MVRPRPARPIPAHRAAVVAAVALAAVVGLSGCSATNEITTQRGYNASDGVLLAVGDTVLGQNLVVVSRATGDPGVLTGALTNNGTTDATVTVTVDGTTPTDVPVAAGSTVLLQGADAVRLGAVDQPPGSTVRLTLAATTAGSASASVPVLDGTLPAYATLLPTP